MTDQPATKPKKLTPKRRAFVSEYLKDLNATQAATRAGYSAHTAGRTGYDLLKIPEIQVEIEREQKRLAEKNDITAERVLEEYRRLAFSDIMSVAPVSGGSVMIKDTSELTPEQRAAVSEVTETKDGLRVKFHSKTAALDSLAKHLNLFNEKMQVEHTMKGPPPVIQIGFGETPEQTDGTPDDNRPDDPIVADQSDDVHQDDRDDQSDETDGSAT